MSNINEFLTVLNTLSEKNSYEVFIPSLKRAVKFKPLSARQQKAFYSCVVDNTLFETMFIMVTFNIIKENCLEPEIINQLTIIDRTAILLAIRKNTLGSIISLTNDDKEYSIDFSPCLELAKSIAVPSNKFCAFKGGLQVELQVPLMIEQYNLEKELRSVVTEESVALEKAVEDVILSESCKLIKDIWILSGNEKTPLNYKSLTTKERLVVVEQLPAEFLTEVRAYISDIVNIQDSLLTVYTDDKVKLAFNIEVDFFLDL